MRELTAVEAAELEKRISAFDAFREERMPVLHKFAELLECPDPHEILLMPEKFLPYISKYLEDQVIEGDNRIWLLTRIGYFVGELLISKLDGCWMVDENPDSSSFSRYVIGDFAERKGVIDPFNLSQIYVDTSAPRSLAELLGKITS